jgi:presqualene diphosphate synthase
MPTQTLAEKPDHGDLPLAAPSVSGSSFYAAMRVLPAPKREAMFEIYAFCRAIDDVADSDASRESKADALRQWRSAIDAIFAGAPPASLRRLASAVTAFGLQRKDFLSIVDGMEMDVATNILGPDDATLDLYCDRVASAVGRLSVRVFGMQDPDGSLLAFHLGRALQLTNILRDLDEDAGIGRLYLPRECLLNAGIMTTDTATVLNHPALGDACAPIVARATSHFEHAEKLLSRYPLSIARAPVLMAKVYRTLLDRLVARGWAPPRRSLVIPRATLAWIMLRHGLV